MKIAEERTKTAVMMQMLLPGVPCIYYGDEAGLWGYGDPFCRNTYPWGNENKDMINWYKKAIEIRKSSDAFVCGEFENIYKDNNVYGFIRFSEKDKYAVIANLGNCIKRVRMDLARYGILSIENKMYEESFDSEDGIFNIEISARDIKVFKCY